LQDLCFEVVTRLVSGWCLSAVVSFSDSPFRFLSFSSNEPLDKWHTYCCCFGIAPVKEANHIIKFGFHGATPLRKSIGFWIAV
jgi:hypothetical protein